MMISNKSELKKLIAAVEAKIATIKNDIDAEISVLQAAAAKEISRFEAYASTLKSAAKLEDGATTSRPSKRKISKAGKRSKSSKVAGRRGRTKVFKTTAAGKGRRAATAKFRKGSLPDRVRGFVLKNTKPVHLSDVVKLLGGPKKASLQSIENRISALARKGAAFVRTAPRTYGLLEMGHSPTKK